MSQFQNFEQINVQIEFKGYENLWINIHIVFYPFSSCEATLLDLGPTR